MNTLATTKIDSLSYHAEVIKDAIRYFGSVGDSTQVELVSAAAVF